VAEISVLLRVSGLSLRDRVRPTGRRPQERPRTHWRDYISQLASGSPRMSWQMLRVRSLGRSAGSAATATRPSIKRMKIDGWILMHQNVSIHDIFLKKWNWACSSTEHRNTEFSMVLIIWHNKLPLFTKCYLRTNPLVVGNEYSALVEKKTLSRICGKTTLTKSTFMVTRSVPTDVQKQYVSPTTTLLFTTTPAPTTTPSPTTTHAPTTIRMLKTSLAPTIPTQTPTTPPTTTLTLTKTPTLTTTQARQQLWHLQLVWLQRQLLLLQLKQQQLKLLQQLASSHQTWKNH